MSQAQQVTKKLHPWRNNSQPAMTCRKCGHQKPFAAFWTGWKTCKDCSTRNRTFRSESFKWG